MRTIYVVGYWLGTYFSNGPESHEKSAKEEICSYAGGSVVAGSSPAHECHAQGSQGEEESDEGAGGIS